MGDEKAAGAAARDVAMGEPLAAQLLSRVDGDWEVSEESRPRLGVKPAKHAAAIDLAPGQYAGMGPDLAVRMLEGLLKADLRRDVGPGTLERLSLSGPARVPLGPLEGDGHGLRWEGQYRWTLLEERA